MKYKLLLLISLFASVAMSAQTTVNMPSPDGTEKTIAVTETMTFYDAEGEVGSIPLYQISGITFTPEVGKRIEINFESIDLQGGSLIKIFDGVKKLSSYYDELDDETYYTIPAGHKVGLSGTKTNETIVSEASDGSLTVFFQNSNGTGAGWKATVRNIPMSALPDDEVRIGSIEKTVEVGITPLNFYDDGGKNGKISQNFNGQITFKPKTLGNRIKIDFTKLALFYNSSAVSVGNQDMLSIYNGTRISEGTLYETLTTKPTIVKSTAPDGSLTVTLKSKTSYPADGFEAVVTEFTPVAMSFETVEQEQITFPAICAGNIDEGILLLNIRTTNDLNPLTTEKISFNTNGTFDNLEKATLYYTGRSKEFSTQNKIGETSIGADNFEITITTPQTLNEGNNYFWLAYDIKQNAENGSIIDAGATSITIAGNKIPVIYQQPEGYKTIKNEYISTIGNFTKKVFGEWKFTHTHASAYSSNYKAETGDQIITFLPGTAGKIMQVGFTDFDIYFATASYGTKAKFIIFSGTGTTGEKLWEVEPNNKSTGPGKTIRSTSSDGALTIVFNANTNSSYYTGKGWHASVSEYQPKNMEFKSAEVSQGNTDIIKPGTVNQEIIGINIKTEGELNPLSLDALTVNLKGAHDKIKKVSVFSTQNKESFDTTGISAHISAPTADDVTLVFDATVNLIEGNNFFWVAYDMNEELASELHIDASLSNLKIGTDIKTPENGDPEGNRISKNIFEMSTGNTTVPVSSSLIFYDNGGATENYKKGEKETVTFTPKAGQVIKLIFKSFNTKYSDNLYVYNGNSEDAPELVKLNGTKLPQDILSTAEDGSLTLSFTPTATYNSGWEIIVQTYTPLPLTITSVKSTSVSAKKLLRGAQNEALLQVEVTVSGDKGTINVSSFSFSNEASTNPSDVSVYNLYSTDTISTLSTTKQYAQSTTSTDEILFSGNTKITQAGVYKFWFTANISSTADINNVVEAKLTAVKQDETTLTLTESEKAHRILEKGFSGTYAIGSSTSADYKTITEAIEAMKGGIDGKVIFEIEKGNYNEAIVLPHISGASAQNTITLKSQTGSSEDVVIERNTYSDPGYGEEKMGVFTIRGTDFLTIEGITFKTDKTAYPAVVFIKNNSNYVTLHNCLVQAPNSSSYSSGNIALVRVEGENTANSNSNFFSIENSVLDGGYSGAYIYGTSYVALPKQIGASIKNNKFRNQGNISIYMTKELGGIIDGNKIEISGTTASTFKAIDAVMMGNTSISNNKIYANSTTSGSVNAIYLRRKDENETISGRNRVYNNEVILNNPKGSTLYGIYASDGILDTDIAYNSVNITKATPSINTAPFAIFSNATKLPANVVVENNIFQNNAGGYVYRLNRAEAQDGLTFANNALFTSGTNFAYSGSAIATVDAWNMVSEENNSIIENVEFISESSLDLKEKGKLNSAKPLDFALTDINGSLRNTSTPTIGAYEFTEILMPEMTDTYPKIRKLTYNSVEIAVKLTENGKIFLSVLKTTDTAPTVEDILSGAGQYLAKNSEETVKISGLEDNTTYKIYYIIQNLNTENSEIIPGDTFTSKNKPTEVSTFENVSITEGEFTDGTANFSGFKVIDISDGQGSNNKKGAKLNTSGVVNITNDGNGLILNGFFLKSDKQVKISTKNGEIDKGSKQIEATNDKWVFINLKDMGEITSVSFQSAGNTIIDNFSGTPQPITLLLGNHTTTQGYQFTISSDIYGGVLPYTYKWTNAKNEVLAESPDYTLTADYTRPITLTVTDSWGHTISTSSILTVLGDTHTATFDDLYLTPETQWRGNPDSETYTSTFYSGSFAFSNSFIPDWKTWGGFAYSNMTGNKFDNFLTDQFKSATGSGVNNSENYAVAYTVGDPVRVSLTSKPEGDVITGFYITNNAWVKHVSEHGTEMPSNDDPTGKTPFKKGDWFKITAKADNGKTKEFYLADYRSENSADHYTLDSWQWFDLRELGMIKSIRFQADGTRKNELGSLIPSYFCMDDLGGKRKIANTEKQIITINKSVLIELASLFSDTGSSEASIIYAITDSMNTEYATEKISGEQIIIEATGKTGTTETIVSRTVKGKTEFIRIPVDVRLNTDVTEQSYNTVSITPNPATHFIALNTSGHIAIYSLNGLKIYENSAYKAGEQINVSSLTAGLYFVKVAGQTMKLLKQ